MANGLLGTISSTFNNTLDDDIKMLQDTDQGIIGMVKMVQFNPEKYPCLSKYDFYQIRKLLSGEEI